MGLTHMWKGHSHVGVTHVWKEHSHVGVTHMWKWHSDVGVTCMWKWHSHLGFPHMWKGHSHVGVLTCVRGILMLLRCGTNHRSEILHSLIFSAVTCPRILWFFFGEVSYSEERIIRRGGFSFVFVYPIGTVATFSCQSGYSLSGSSTRTCGSSGSWTSQSPSCNLGKKNYTFLATKLNLPEGALL